MGRLSGHPHIVTILQVGATASGRPYIVMPYHAKDSLEALIRRHGPLDWCETLSIGVKLAGALEAAHRAGTLHRDVKPGNILLTDYGEPQLTDFGIARIAGGFQTATGVITGSPAFTAPEVLEGATPDAGIGRVLAGRDAVLRADRPRRIRTAQRRAGGRSVPADHLAADSGSARRRDCPPTWRRSSNAPWRGIPRIVPATAAEFGDELREVQRRNGLTVDEMARPVDLGVERREGAVARVHGSSGYLATPTPPTPATKYRPPVPTSRWSPAAGSPTSFVRRTPAA